MGPLIIGSLHTPLIKTGDYKPPSKDFSLLSHEPRWRKESKEGALNSDFPDRQSYNTDFSQRGKSMPS